MVALTIHSPSFPSFPSFPFKGKPLLMDLRVFVALPMMHSSQRKSPSGMEDHPRHCVQKKRERERGKKGAGKEGKRKKKEQRETREREGERERERGRERGREGRGRRKKKERGSQRGAARKGVYVCVCV